MPAPAERPAEPGRPAGPTAGPAAEPRRVRLVERGPVLIDGPVEVVLPDGTRRLVDRPVVALCTCRRSRRYPLCDTSHRRGAHRPAGPR